MPQPLQQPSRGAEPSPQPMVVFAHSAFSLLDTLLFLRILFPVNQPAKSRGIPGDPVSLAPKSGQGGAPRSGGCERRPPPRICTDVQATPGMNLESDYRASLTTSGRGIGLPAGRKNRAGLNPLAVTATV